jgi:hypothetical protein
MKCAGRQTPALRVWQSIVQEGTESDDGIMIYLYMIAAFGSLFLVFVVSALPTDVMNPVRSTRY